jgi:hypothetical protein
MATEQQHKPHQECAQRTTQHRDPQRRIIHDGNAHHQKRYAPGRRQQQDLQNGFQLHGNCSVFMQSFSKTRISNLRRIAVIAGQELST